MSVICFFLIESRMNYAVDRASLARSLALTTNQKNKNGEINFLCSFIVPWNGLQFVVTVECGVCRAVHSKWLTDSGKQWAHSRAYCVHVWVGKKKAIRLPVVMHINANLQSFKSHSIYVFFKLQTNYLAFTFRSKYNRDRNTHTLRLSVLPFSSSPRW